MGPQLEQSWEAEEGLVEVKNDSTTTLILQNPTDITIHLQEGDILGELQLAEEVPDSVGEEPSGKVLAHRGDRDKRTAELWRKLEIEDRSSNNVELAQLWQVVEDYNDVFALDDSELGVAATCQHVINTGDHQPIRQLPRRVPFALRQKIDEMVGEMLEKGIIQPSKSPWASPVVLVSKKDGSLCFCVDYRKLNAVTKLDVFPLHRTDDSCWLIPSISPRWTWQVPMESQSQEKTAFCTPSGLYEFYTTLRQRSNV